MHSLRTKITTGSLLAFAGSLLVLAMIITGCSSSIVNSSSSSNLVTSTNTSVSPTRITDAPSDQVLAASLTLNSMILTDSSGKVTTNLLPASGITFEATHLDAVQEPFFSPAIPEDTYVSVALTYSNAQVAYIDPTTKAVELVTATLANTSQTITFSSPITINNTTTSLLVDFLVAQSVAISGSTVTVTPVFDVTAVPIPNTPTNGTNGLLTGYKGKVTAIDTGANSFTLTNASGTALTVYVNSATVYQGISGFSALQVNALVDVDAITENASSTLPAGSLLAIRVEVDDIGTTPKKMLLGPVTSVTGSPATSFNMLTRQLVGNASPTAVETIDVTVTGATNFLLPPRYTVLATASPFAPSFTASTIFAGQQVGVIATDVTSGAATASTVLLEPQTVDGAISSITTSGAYTVYTLTLPSGNWLATLTGQTTVLVYTNNLVQPINTTAPAVSAVMRFNGYLFKVNGTLRLLACVQAGPPGTPITAGTVGHQ
jgi:hypothetical protein